MRQSSAGFGCVRKSIPALFYSFLPFRLERIGARHARCEECRPPIACIPHLLEMSRRAAFGTRTCSLPFFEIPVSILIVIKVAVTPEFFKGGF